MGWFVAQEKRELAENRRGLDKVKQRVTEIDRLIQKLHEDNAASKGADLQKFIHRARQVTSLTKLTPEIVHEFIEKIVVSKSENVDVKRRQKVDIYYNASVLWAAPSPEEMEELFKTCLSKKRKKAA